MTATRTPDAPPRTAPAAAPGRDAHLDNAKFLLIVLVVLGHAYAPIRDTLLTETLYKWIYLFHMPAFVLICGYLSKSFDGSGRRMEKLVTTVGVPYLIFWTVYSIQAYTSDRGVPMSPLEPIWITWFLVALFIWRLSTPLWKAMRWSVVIAVVISVAAAGLVTGDVLMLSRVLSLLPFFVLGLFLEPKHLAILRSPAVRAVSVLVMAVTLAFSALYLVNMSTEWVYWRESLEDRDVELLPLGLPARIVFLGLALVLSLAFLSLVPGRHTWFTKLGEYTMFVFLLHGLPIRIADQLGLYDLVDGYPALAITTAASLLLSVLLCTRLVRKATSWAVEPSADWILRRKTQSAASSEKMDATPPPAKEPAVSRQ